MSDTPKLFVLRKTQNGWIVTEDDGLMNNADVAACFVFETIGGVCDHLQRQIGAAPHPRPSAKSAARTK